MTATAAELLEMIDLFLADTAHQSLIDAGRVRDLLLDLRSEMTEARRES